MPKKCLVTIAMFPWEFNDGGTTKRMELELGFESKNNL
jgi:hypothetical protein